jgi:hypothetical protein
VLLGSEVLGLLYNSLIYLGLRRIGRLGIEMLAYIYVVMTFLRDGFDGHVFVILCLI